MTLPAPSPRAIAAVAGAAGVATAVCAVVLVGGEVELGPAEAARWPTGTTVSAGWALVLVVVALLAVTARAGWRRSARTGELAVLAGAAVIGAVLMQLQVIRDFSWIQPLGLACGAVLSAMGLLASRLRKGTGRRPGAALPRR
jgi:hypothetical protein